MNTSKIPTPQPNKVFLFFLLICISSIFAQGVSAQIGNSEKDKKIMSAVMAVITSYLLNDRSFPIPEPAGERVDIELGQTLPDTYSVDDSWFVAFELQPQDVELCFDIASSTPLLDGDVAIEINGEPVALSVGKDNCFVIPEHQQRSINYVHIKILSPSITLTLSAVELLVVAQSEFGLSILTRGGWDQIAVRKVIKIFAFGGHATDSQIQVWADMRPKDAIQQMLTFAEHNHLLSPLAVNEQYDDSANAHGTLEEFANFLSDPSSNLPIPVDNREQFGIDNYNFDDAFVRMVTTRGLNPFRQRIGFWETNYHLAVNLDTAVSGVQLATYYDKIMQAHEAGLPYSQVIGVAAKSAAVAMQYGHRNNQWIFDDTLGEFVCDCNDDFAREIHQLFYGIFGTNDPNHEDGTIRETAKMLTDMRVPYIDGFGFATEVNFETEEHHSNDLTILGQIISGVNANAKIDTLMPVSMQHPESLHNLPIMIISVLADDNLNESRANQLRAAWQNMGAGRTLLKFIQTYAISKQFHSEQQVKYLTSHERALYMANKHNFDNFESYYGGNYYDGGRAGRDVDGVVEVDAAGNFFRPSHNVFGGQTSLEASDSALAFEKNYNRLVEQEYILRTAVQCDDCNQGQPWEKAWQNVLPQRYDGQFYVADVARWLWNHVAGSLESYSLLEQAHLYTLLGAVRSAPGTNYDQNHVFDLSLLMCLVEDYQLKQGVGADISLANLMSNNVWDRYCVNWDDGGQYTTAERAALNRVYNGQDIANNTELQGLLDEMANQTLPLNTITGANDGADLREHARERISNALAFIFTTPFVFAEGRQ